MYDVIVIGGGPSGLMCSIKASETKKVLLIEKNDQLGKKILASGNGRCNVTNLKSDMDFIANVQSSNPKFLLSALKDFGPWDIYSYFAERDCLIKEEDDNRAFPESDLASDILEVLKNALNNVDVKLSESLVSVEKTDFFTVNTNKGSYKCKNLVLALGGKSYPALGTTGDGYSILEDFGLNVTKQYPALTSLNSNDKIIVDKEFMGLTVDCSVKFKKEYRGNLLFTHFGVSGPAIFKVSEEVLKELEYNKQVEINVDLLPNYSVEELMEEIVNNQSLSISSIFKKLVSNRIVKVLLGDNYNKKNSQLSKQEILRIVDSFKLMKITIHGSKGFKSAFVTSGGLDLSELNPKTMEVKKVPGLYVIGELLDLHAYTGGYNITIALSTGYKAGINIK